MAQPNQEEQTEQPRQEEEWTSCIVDRTSLHTKESRICTRFRCLNTDQSRSEMVRALFGDPKNLAAKSAEDELFNIVEYRSPADSFWSEITGRQDLLFIKLHPYIVSLLTFFA